MSASVRRCALLMMLVPFAVSAAGPAASAPRMATKEEYLACVLANESLEAKRTAFAERDTRQRAQAAKFQAAEADLAAQVKRHAPSKKAERESYNRAVEARNASAESLNRETRAIQAEQAALNTLILETNTRCGGILVSAEIIKDVEAGRRDVPTPR